MWQKAATNVEARELVQVGIGKDRRELQDLVERGVRSGGFCVVEDVVHNYTLARIRPSAKPKFQLADFNQGVTLASPHY